MSALFDTNVVVYALDRDEPRKQAVADALLDEHVRARTLVTSTQVLQESYKVLTRRKRVPPGEALDFVRMLARREVVPSSADFVLRALALSDAAKLSVWDALVVQAALDARCSTLFSEDLQSGRRFGDLQIVDPFAAGAHEPAPSGFAHPVLRKAPARPLRKAAARPLARRPPR